MRAFAPGRVNLIGDHVDYVGGLVLPMAVDLGTTVTFEPGGQTVELTSDDDPDIVRFSLPVASLPETPSWGRLVAAAAAEVEATTGGRGHVASTLPLGAGLSSSASLEVAVALALGARFEPTDLARRCQRAEQRATGVPTGIMDQLTICSGTAGSALLIDCHELSVRACPLPPGTAVYAVHSGVTRRLEGSEYGDRRAACARAEEVVGPLRTASIGDLRAITDPVDRRRARHVVTEIARVWAAAATDDPHRFGALMDEGHASLRDDFEVSVPEVDALVARLRALPGVYGVRITGAGFGGCVVVLADEQVPAESIGGWRLRPAGAARVLDH